MTRRLAGALALVCVAIAVAGCSDHTSHRGAATTTTDAAPSLPHVLVLGDSNLFQSGAQVDAALRAAGVEPTLLGVPGYGVKDLFFWLRKIPELLEPDPDVVVVGLGTNDALERTDVERFPARLDRMMQALGDRPVIWITHVDDRPAAPASAGRAINEFIRAAPARWPNLTVLDFAVDIATDPTILRADGLHFSETGMHAYGARIEADVARRLTNVPGIYN